MTALEKLMQSMRMTCLACGHVGPVGSCECNTVCSCGWIADKGKPCRNPATARCSTKVRYGKYNRKTGRYE